MKKFRTLIATLMTLIFVSGSAFAFNSSEQAAQTAFVNYLKTKRIPSKVDDKDNSVNFYDGKVLFWVTFDGSATGMLFTLHRAPINMKSAKDPADKNARRLENAYRAADFMNLNNNFKTVVRGSKVEFLFPVYAASTEDYVKVFDRILRNFENCKEYFDECYNKAKAYNDSVHKYWMENDTAYMVVEQNVKVARVTYNAPVVTITKVDFQGVDRNGNPIYGYADNKYAKKMKYIQPKIVAKASKKGLYRISTQIEMPNGKILVPNRDSKMTTTSTVEIGKNDTDIILDMFGDDTGEMWEPGEYNVVFFENGKPVNRSSFNIL